MFGRGVGRARRYSDDDEREPSSGSDDDTETSETPHEPAMRGRGGMRYLVTKPSNIEETNATGPQQNKIRLLCNYIGFEVTEDCVIYNYHVDFRPHVDASFVRRGLIAKLAENFHDAYIFDGMSNLKMLNNMEDCVLDVERYKQGQPSGEWYKVRFRQVNSIQFGEPEMLHFYNTQMRRNLLHMGLTAIGRYYYHKNPRVRIPGDDAVSILQGFLTAVNIHDGGIFSVCNTIFKFVRHRTVFQVLKWHCNKGENWRENVRREINGSIVMTLYNNKTYRIADIDFSLSPSSTFEKTDGTSISYIEYYQSQHETKINDERQPLLIAAPTDRSLRGNAPKVFLIPELCYLTGLSDTMKNNHEFMRQISNTTKVNPTGRVKLLREFISIHNGNEKINDEMRQWKLKLKDDLVRIFGFVHPSEKLKMGDRVTDIKGGDFSRDLRDREFNRRNDLSETLIVCTNRDVGTVRDFIHFMITNNFGISCIRKPPVMVIIENDRPASYLEALRHSVEYELAIAVVPNQNKDRYDVIKKYCCLERGVASQVINSRTLSKKANWAAICTKIVIQIGCKTGSIPWSIEIPPKDIMVIGFDTHHDTVKRSDSVGGFVCSLNDSFTRYYSRAIIHARGVELCAAFESHISAALKAYRMENNKLPERILFYRDGVSNGMIEFVYKIELQAVLKAIDTFNGEKIRMAFIIVNKRLNSRFFHVKSDSSIENPPCGTVVDTVVTRKERYDFYLISQSVNVGTVSPTLFNIIHDQTNLKPANHHSLAYKLTHLYFNWAGTVKVPAPCQYAHKLAYLVGQSLHIDPHPKLQGKLYYL